MLKVLLMNHGICPQYMRKENKTSTPNPNARDQIQSRTRAEQSRARKGANKVMQCSTSKKKEVSNTPHLFTTLVRPLLIRSHLTLITLDPLLPLSTRHTTNRTTLRSSILFLLPLLLINLNKPLVLVVLVLALISPAGHPLAARLIVLQLPAALLVHACCAGLLVVFADALLAREQLPFRGGFGCWQGLVPGQHDVWCWEGQEHTVFHG